MSSLTKVLILVAILLAAGAGLVIWKKEVGSHHAIAENISKSQMELLLRDLNPMTLRQIAQSPEAKKEVAENVEQLFAIASQAKKDGLASDVNIKRELDSIETEILAVAYDKHMRTGKENMPTFGLISEERVKQFWDASDAQPTFWDKIGFGENTAESREAAFNKFLDAKLKLARESGSLPPDREITDEEREQAREYFAKTRIYAQEAEQKRNELGSEFWEKVELQTKLQEAQFLARLYAQKVLAKKVEVTDADIKKYLAEHPEVAGAGDKRAKAEEILNRLKAGEDFAKLADEFSEDPGSKGKGGLYEGITRGSFEPTFESAALGLQEGQFTQELVETPFGFHIIKLEKKATGQNQSGGTAETYDVRHILISTMMKDPDNPTAREMPINEFIRAKLEKEKEEKVLEEIKKNNPVEVAQNFEIDVSAMPEQPQLTPEMMMPEEMPESAPQSESPQNTKKTAPPKK